MKRPDDRTPFTDYECRGLLVDAFKQLVDFAAEVCGATPQEVCPLHLLAWKLRREAETTEPVKPNTTKCPDACDCAQDGPMETRE